MISSKARDTINEIFVKFKLTNDLEINLIDMEEIRSKIKSDLDPKFIYFTENGQQRIDFTSITTEFGVKNYDQNLKSANLDFELNNPHFLSFWSHVNSFSTKHPFRSIQVCSNGEIYQRQKADLLVRALLGSNQVYNVQYVPIGHVNGPNALECFSQREAYFREAAIQRQMIPDENLVESNLESLSLFSIVYDLLGTGHHKDVKLNAIENSELAKMNEQSAFVLYNCARLNAILEKFNTRIKQGKIYLSLINL